MVASVLSVIMEERDSPYVFRDETDGRVGDLDPNPDGSDVVIIEGHAMTYRAYRGAE